MTEESQAPLLVEDDDAMLTFVLGPTDVALPIVVVVELLLLLLVCCDTVLASEDFKRHACRRCSGGC